MEFEEWNSARDRRNAEGIGCSLKVNRFGMCSRSISLDMEVNSEDGTTIGEYIETPPLKILLFVSHYLLLEHIQRVLDSLDQKKKPLL